MLVCCINSVRWCHVASTVSSGVMSHQQYQVVSYTCVMSSVKRYHNSFRCRAMLTVSTGVRLCQWYQVVSAGLAHLMALRSCWVGALSSQDSTSSSVVTISPPQWRKPLRPTRAGCREVTPAGLSRRRQEDGRSTFFT